MLNICNKGHVGGGACGGTKGHRIPWTWRNIGSSEAPGMGARNPNWVLQEGQQAL